MGDYLFTKGFLEEAKDVFLNLVHSQETNEENKLRLAEIYIEEGEDDEAFHQLLSIQPHSSYYLESLMIQADLYQTQGLYEVSEQKLQEAYNLAPDEPVLLFALAEIHFEQGEYQSSIREYTKLLNKNIEEFADVSILSRLTEATSLVGDWENAVSLYKELVLKQGSPENHFKLAFTYFQLEDYDSAIKYLNLAKEVDPSYTTIYPLLVESYNKKENFNQAKEALEQGIARDQTNSNLFFSGSNLFKAEGDIEKARDLLEKGLALNPDQSGKIELADMIEQQSDLEKALEVLGNDENESDPFVLWRRATIKEDLEDFSGASLDYQKASPYLITDEQFLKDYILFLRDEGKWEEAKEYLEKAKKESSINIEALSFLESIIRKD